MIIILFILAYLGIGVLSYWIDCYFSGQYENEQERREDFTGFLIAGIFIWLVRGIYKLYEIIIKNPISKIYRKIILVGYKLEIKGKEKNNENN